VSTRPADRPLRQLPMLEKVKGSLETCVFCPKLCRSECPVSNAAPKETWTPWGKMSLAYFVGRGDVEASPPFAAPAWACTGCGACRSACEHHNDVAESLLVARANLMDIGIAPPRAARQAQRFELHRRATERAVARLGAQAGVDSSSRTALLIGCAYARAAPAEASDAIVAAASLSDGKVSLVSACCGLPLLYAGDRAGFVRQATTLAHEVRAAESLLVADAGCAHALRARYPSVGVSLSPKPELLVERAVLRLGRLRRLAAPPKERAAPVRYHDPCLLGRGLGVYDAPRAVLARALGRSPEEFHARREKAHCSGAGGSLPVTMPAEASAIARSRIEEHEADGGGTLVTACASSLLHFRRGNARAIDLVSFLARAAAKGPS
jgi:dimethylglycine catabolism B